MMDHDPYAYFLNTGLYFYKSLFLIIGYGDIEISVHLCVICIQLVINTMPSADGTNRDRVQRE